MDVNIFLFNDFETLDVFGPVEIFGRLENYYRIRLFSLQGGVVFSRQKVPVVTLSVSQIDPSGVLLIPGGEGTRALVDDDSSIEALKVLAQNAPYCLTVCTGTALLARTTLLNGIQATTNKKAFAWVESLNDKVKWIYSARWVVDGKFYTSSGVSAGMDMALGFICDCHGRNEAEEIARRIEYVWNDRAEHDLFAV